MDFGKRVKALRRERKLTKEELCQDETELSVRQLTRIENGQSTPTLNKVEFIAHRLGVQIGELTDTKRFELPKRYKELKFLLLRTQTYADPEKLVQNNLYFDEIFEHFYDDLPEEELLIIDILSSRKDLLLNNETFTAKKILEEYLAQVQIKTTYSINDLILLRLYFAFILSQDSNTSFYQPNHFESIVINLIKHIDNFPLEEQFVLNNTLLSAASAMLSLNSLDHLPAVVEAAELIMQRTQDFLKAPIFSLLRWKSVIATDKAEAEFHFQQACLFAKFTTDTHLLEMLKKEWETDSMLY